MAAGVPWRYAPVHREAFLAVRDGSVIGGINIDSGSSPGVGDTRTAMPESSGGSRHRQSSWDARPQSAQQDEEVGRRAAVARRATGSSAQRREGAQMSRFTGFVLLALTLAFPRPGRAANTCNGIFTIDYVAGPEFAVPGDVVRVRLTLGTGSIQGGTNLRIHRLRFDLDCNNNFPLGLPCTDETMKVEYEGDGTITTTCGVGWTTGHAVSANPNEVVFTPSVGVNIPATQTIP